ncbi:hypothetical protein SCP_1102510 [Sparassis crispa]|uniref:Mob1/phocein n=1 Tax=Sparassis crispa TaxID=139825 RepID=A0A401GZI5_9APHY|nr:hypothetical protein SCP_1102510 [Sparassis crispa]GBE87574.1 hypothetical protein SCP_1102510 [Sparassis crispa]
MATTTTFQRPLKGSRISSFYPVKTLPPLSSLDSAFQLQEYISLLIRRDVHDVDAIVSVPEKSSSRDRDAEGGDEDAKREKGMDKDSDGKNDVSVDEACWIYEQLRRIAQDLSHPLITMLQQECTRQTCPEMKAGEWLYLCVAHGNDGAMEQCCAIDYILHTLDGATALLNSPRAFPSRLSIPPASHRHFSSLARRLSRIFAHAYFHHRAAFAQAEAESALYARFLALTARFNLVPVEFLVVPQRFASYVNGTDDDDDEEARNKEAEPPRLLGAAVDPRNFRELLARRAESESGDAGPGATLGPGNLVENAEGREASPAGPRRIGRNRTDTMVHSEAASVIEELGKGEPEVAPEAIEEVGVSSTVPVEESAQVGLESQLEPEVPDAAALSEVETAETTAPPSEEPGAAVVEEEVDVTAAAEVELSPVVEPVEPAPTPVSVEESPAEPEPQLSSEAIPDLSISELTVEVKAPHSEASATLEPVTTMEQSQAEEEITAPSEADEAAVVVAEEVVTLAEAVAEVDVASTEESLAALATPEDFLEVPSEAEAQIPATPLLEPEVEKSGILAATEEDPEAESQTEQPTAEEITHEAAAVPASRHAAPTSDPLDAVADPAGEDGVVQGQEEGSGDDALVKAAVETPEQLAPSGAEAEPEV